MRTHVDLFSGIGGFALACRWAGIKTVAFCEIDAFCQKVLKKNFPGVPVYDDIKTFNYAGEPPFVLTGGFPCQPFSSSGHKRGPCGDDRYLWPQMLEVIRRANPRWVVAENVTGIDNSSHLVLDTLLADLERIQYETGIVEIPACAVNAPHKRMRVFILAHAKVFGQKPDQQEPEILQTQGKDRTGPSGGVGSAWWNDGKRSLWESEPDIYRVADGIPNWMDRNGHLGNAIVPQVAYEIIRAIVEVDT